jgi:hypothetical protein
MGNILSCALFLCEIYRFHPSSLSSLFSFSLYVSFCGCRSRSTRNTTLAALGGGLFVSSGSGMFPFPSYIIAGGVFFLQHPNFLTCINDEGFIINILQNLNYQSLL